MPQRWHWKEEGKTKEKMKKKRREKKSCEEKAAKTPRDPSSFGIACDWTQSRGRRRKKPQKGKK